ncbi:SusC/RagA family TonB-linked outer membrane protein [Chryseobacterium sp. SG20098]|uniref:SusC/RagA family TonB-linked outer membrane protein n=1 Tax=Chryseobacterium sp. SG20098 TaxID=3074145 RepID=UPI002883272D|nr:SusC/RagA family TonB-linked outer membrane protein [Chryseobacterium sp. SG20098]WNI35660.1 SusC/RagA family TonB-linked outer membrane protein [Chryseobacterium sp. SG20098]
MNVKLRVLSAGALFFLGQAAFAQTAKKDTTSKVKQIDEVVVLGYSKTATKAKSTAASTTISEKVLEDRPNASFLNSLQGAAPGITINSSSGSPGSGRIDVRVRGIGSLNSTMDPLYVIDGMSTNGTQFRNLNPEDIATISVLRDAAATSIYGNRAANGVVIITTKNGTYNSGMKLSYGSTIGFSAYPKHNYNLVNGSQYRSLQNEFVFGPDDQYTPEEVQNAPNTDWKKQYFQTGMTQQHNLGMTFGGKNISVYSSLGYFDMTGIVKSTDFKRFSFRNNINGKSNDGRFTYGSQLAVGYSKRHQLDQETNVAGLVANPLQNPLFSSILARPDLEPNPYTRGSDMYKAIGAGYSDRIPWVTQDIINGGVQNVYTETSVLANVNFAYKLTDYLTVGHKSGIDFKESDRAFARAPYGYLALVAKAGNDPYGGIEVLNNVKDFNINSITNLTFNKSWGDHTLEVGAYLDYIKAHYRTKQYQQNGLNPLTWVLGAGTGYVPYSTTTPTLYVPNVTAQNVNAGALAYFATADYDYAGKYGFTGMIRRDGAYRFSKENRWNTFWAVSGRWNIDKEAFMEGSVFDMLKLRSSYGTQGNQNLGITANNLNPLVNPATTTLFRNVFQTSTAYLNQQGLSLTVLGNPDVRWETQKMFNVGLDFVVFDRKLEGNFDYYIKTTENLFNKLNISAASNGVFTIDGNNGRMRNNGVEASLRYNIFNKGDFRLSVFANGSFNKNTILELPYGYSPTDNVNAAGSLAFQWNLIRYAGVNKETGEMQFLDKNGNITENPNDSDRVLTGKSYYPRYQGGFGLNGSFKGVFADVLFSWQAGGWQYDNLYQWLVDPNSIGTGNNVSADLFDSWTPDNKNAGLPSITANNTGADGSSDRYLYKTDFIRLKTISIGYSFPKASLEKLPIKGLKLFVQGENLVTWSNWKGLDPEPVTDFSLSVYPNPKTFSIGFNVEF